MRISDWSSDVCSSDLRCERSRRIDCFNPLMALELSDYGICLDIPTSCRQPARRFRHHARHHQEKQTTGTGYDEHYAQYLGWQKDRKSVVWGKSVSVSVDLGGRSIIKTKNKSITERRQH